MIDRDCDDRHDEAEGYDHGRREPRRHCKPVLSKYGETDGTRSVELQAAVGDESAARV
jgi:hypothetical protein